MSKSEAIEPFPSSYGERPTLDRARLIAVLDECGLALDEVDVCVAIFAADQGAPAEFEIRVGNWRLDGARGVLSAVVNGVVMTAALAAIGGASIPVAIVSLVVPVIFNLERVEIRPSDRVVLAELLRDPWGRQLVADWYAELPDHVTDEVTLLEFRDILGRLEDAGLAEVDHFEIATIDAPSPRRLAHLRLPPNS